MRSVADQLRGETRARNAVRSLDDRLRQCFSLAERDARVFAAARAISVEESRRALARQRQHGRRRSVCHESLFE
jgi:hypothetical protein